MDNSQYQKDLANSAEYAVKHSKEYKSASKNFGIAQAVEIYNKSDYEKEKVIVAFKLFEKEITEQIDNNPKYSAAKTVKKEITKEYKAKLLADPVYTAMLQKYEINVNDPEKKSEVAVIAAEIKQKETENKKDLKADERYVNACQVVSDFNRSKADRLKEPKISANLCVKCLSEMKKLKKSLKEVES
jgi:hypothetical protein